MWQSGTPLRSIDDAGVLTKIPNPDIRKVGSTLCYIHRDHLASVKLETVASGAIAMRQRFTAFGQKIRSRPHPAALNPAASALQRHDADTGLLDLNARWYDPALGLFVNPGDFDPIDAKAAVGGGATGWLANAVGTNRYAYAGNDPVNKADPNGHSIVGDFFRSQAQYSYPKGSKAEADAQSKYGGGGVAAAEMPALKPNATSSWKKDVKPVDQTPPNAGKRRGVVVTRGYAVPTVGPFKLWLFRHAEVTVENVETGEVFSTRGGPTRSFPFTIQTQATDWSKSADYGHIVSWEILGTFKGGFDEISTKMESMSKAVNDARIPYLGLISNSNSYAFSVSSELGFYSPPPKGINPPGWQFDVVP